MKWNNPILYILEYCVITDMAEVAENWTSMKTNHCVSGLICQLVRTHFLVALIHKKIKTPNQTNQNKPTNNFTPLDADLPFTDWLNKRGALR